MPAVAEVQFKAVNSQQVVTAFNSVGNAAQQGTTKINQNSNAMKTMGQGMKGSISGIGQVTTAFAALSLSIVSTWRAYRDLGDAQIAVDKANLRVQKTTEAIRKTEAEVAKLKKENAKGGAASVAATNKIRLAEEKLYKARKDGKHTAAEIAVMEDELNKLKSGGTESSKKLEDAENKLALQKEQLGVQTDVAAEAQERFNDIQQDFYLSILPLGISSIASLTSAFKGLGGVLRGGGGLLGGLGPIGLILGGITLAIIAFKTNFLGLKDAVGGVIDWIKARFGLWKDTIEKVFNLIKGGKWGEAFNMIKEAAAKFWEDLKKSVPFFAGVATLVDQIAKGNWSGAFDTIKSAAITFWTELKAAVPFFGTIETIIKQISEGNWEGAFKTVADSIMKGLGAIGGEKWVLKFQLMRDTAIAEFNLLANTLTKPGGAIDLINQGLAKLGKGDIVGGFSSIGAGVKKALDSIALTINSWVLTNFGVDLSKINAQATAIGNKILDGIKSGLTFVARTWIDPIIVALLDPATWTTAILALGGAVVSIGSAIFNAIAGAITSAAEDPKGAASWWEGIGTAIWSGITTWFTTNLPQATEVMKAMAQSLTDAVSSSSTALQNVGRAMWNQIVEGFKALSPAFAAEFDKIKLPMLEPEVKPKLNDEPLIKAWTKNVKTIENAKIIPKVQANTQPFTSLTNKAIQNAQSREARIRVTADVRAFNKAVANLSRAARIPIQGHQHGYQSTVKRPTMFMAGEGGRPEDVTVRPRGSVQRGGGGSSGGGPTIINVYVDGVLQRARYTINENQGVFK